MFDVLEQGMRRQPPPRVRYAAAALWAAWTLGAAALIINQVVFHGSGIGPGPWLGAVALSVQAVAIASLGRASVAGRAVVMLFAVIAALPLQMVSRLVVEGADISALSTVIGFALKATGVYLLFTGSAARWFSSQSSHR